MQKNLLYCMPIIMIFSVSLIAMQDGVWVKTNDGKVSRVAPHILKSSFLLRELHNKDSGSLEQPILIPSNCSIDTEALKLYCIHQKTEAEALYTTLLPNDYYRLMDATEKVKDLRKYISLMRHILPKENDKVCNTTIFSSHITEKWIGNLIAPRAIKEKYTRHNFAIAQPYNAISKPQIAISPDGVYFMHDFSMRPNKNEPLIKICNTKTKQEEHVWINTDFQKLQSTEQQMCFSPNNDFAIVGNLAESIFFYDIKHQKEHVLLPFEDHDVQQLIISISDDGKYILCQRCLPWTGLAHDIERCLLWHVDEQNNPQKISLRKYFKTKDFSYKGGPVFHPDSKHIIYTDGYAICSYNIATGKDALLVSYGTNMYFNDLLSMSASADKMLVICKGTIDKGRRRSLSEPRDVMLFSIERHGIIAQNLLPSHSKHNFLHIPNKNLIIDPGCETLRIFDEKATKIVSHDRLTGFHFVNVLAVDKYEKYFAAGYSDGYIALWDLSTLDKKVMVRNLYGPRKSVENLIFTDNQLLFSCFNPSILQGGTREAILWDMQGNKVINFGNNIYKAEISKNGKTVIIVRSHEASEKTIECYDLDVKIPVLTLNQALTFLEEEKLLS